MEGGEGEDFGVETTEDLGDLELRTAEEASGATARQTSAIIWDDIPWD